jgi:carbonic anhydrase/acetyltransferase-like protein (isoleucine patch superfamily)
MAVYTLDDVAPRIAESAWVADSAQVIGNVELSEDASVWFGVVVRGDTAPIHIGKGTNIQDASVLHADFGKPLIIGDYVTVGHKAHWHWRGGAQRGQNWQGLHCGRGRFGD